MKHITRFNLFLLFFFINTFLSISNGVNLYNAKDYGAKGDGRNDDSFAINKLISSINAKISKEKSLFNSRYKIYFPSGTYILNNEIRVSKLIDIEGESNQTTILKVTGNNNEAIIITYDEKDKIHNEGNYNELKNLAIIGPDFDKNPFAWKDLKRNNPRSVGIRILGIRNRISSCSISGFLWSGIEISSSYLNLIDKCYILNNRVGLIINNTSTTTYITQNEFRYNSIGIIIRNNSFGNFVNNNTLESNIGNYLDDFNSEVDVNIEKKGVGILISNAHMNFVNNNYFEQHVINFLLDNAVENNFSDNYIAIGELLPYKGTSQQLIRFNKQVKNNIIINNRIAVPYERIDKYNIIMSDLSEDYSSNIINFNAKDNEIIKIKLSNKYKNTKNIPSIGLK